MKKILLSTALLGATAGMAAAEVSFSGYGRFGLEYREGRAQETQIAMRLQFNINTKVETDSGVTFGGRIRMQYTDGGNDGTANNNGDRIGSATISPAYVYASYEGFRVEVGNSNTAYDSAALMYDSEMGFLDTSSGDPIGDFYAFAATPGDYGSEINRMGIFASYSVGDFNGRVSYVTPDQTDDSLPVGTEEELGISLDYTFGSFTVSAAYVTNGLGIADNDLTFVGAAYTFNDVGTAGILYFKDDLNDDTLVTLYGNYKFNAITARAYVGFSEDLGSEDTSFGLGADYDLGGARLSGSIQSNFDGDMEGDVGVRFDF